MIKPLFDVFRAAMMSNPTGSRKEQMDHFVATVSSDQAYLEKLAIDYFERMSATWVVSGDEHRHSFGRTEVAIDKGERISQSRRSAPTFQLTPRRKTLSPTEMRSNRAAAAERTESAFEELKTKVRSIILLDLTLPDGKPLRDATGAECEKAGGFFTAVGRSIKPTQVVDRQLSEGDLQNIRLRFYKEKETA